MLWGGSMTRDELLNKWAGHAELLSRWQCWVYGPDICAEFLADFERFEKAKQEEVLTLEEAAQVTGYSAAHIARLARDGKLRSLRPPGSRSRYRFQRSDLPQKPTSSNTAGAGVHDLASRLLGGKEGRNGRS
jgi:excisionase family DNA binding protein